MQARTVYMYVYFIYELYTCKYMNVCMYVRVFVQLLYVNFNRFICVYLMNVTMNVLRRSMNVCM